MERLEEAEQTSRTEFLKSTLPPEVYVQAVQYVHASDLPALACASKAFQVLAETRLYQHVVMKDPASVYLLYIALQAREFFRASYVKRLWVYQDPRLNRGLWSRDIWSTIRTLLTKLGNLENTYICDEASVNTFIFNTTRIRFQLREANLGFRWDDAFVSFLESQHELRTLTIRSVDEDDSARRLLSSGSLQKLESLDGPLCAAVDLILSPLKRLCIHVDEENAPLFSAYITEFSRMNKTLRSLNVQRVPEYLVADTLRVLASSSLSASLRYLGILTMPVTEHHDIHRSLLKFERLEVMQVDLSHWTPLPMFYHFAMVATDLHTYCTTLRYVVIWVNTHEYLGRYENERWVFHHLPGQRHPSRDGQWREY